MTIRFTLPSLSYNSIGVSYNWISASGELHIWLSFGIIIIRFEFG